MRRDRPPLGVLAQLQRHPGGGGGAIPAGSAQHPPGNAGGGGGHVRCLGAHGGVSGRLRLQCYLSWFFTSDREISLAIFVAAKSKFCCN